MDFSRDCRKRTKCLQVSVIFLGDFHLSVIFYNTADPMHLYLPPTTEQLSKLSQNESTHTYVFVFLLHCTIPLLCKASPKFWHHCLINCASLLREVILLQRGQLVSFCRLTQEHKRAFAYAKKWNFWNDIFTSMSLPRWMNELEMNVKRKSIIFFRLWQWQREYSMPEVKVFLIYGNDWMRVTNKKQQYVVYMTEVIFSPFH